MVKVYFHGRPAGQDFWPAENQIINSDLIYLKSFLDYNVGTTESSVMVIDQINGNSYYTYLHRRNLYEKVHRPDSYSAITVCLEKKSCLDVYSLYNLLDKAYNGLFKSNILSKTSNEEKFLINSYSEKPDVLAKYSNLIKSYLAEIEMSDNVINIDTQNYTGTKFSLEEADSELFKEASKTSKIIISEDYPPRFKILEDQNDELQQRLSQVELKHAKALEKKEKLHKEEIAKFNNLLEQNESTISDLKNKIKEAEAKTAELEKLIDNSPIAKKWNELKPEIEKFVGLWTQKFQIKQSNNPPKPTISINKIATYTNTFLLIVILILSLNKCETFTSVIPNPTDSIVDTTTLELQNTQNIETMEFQETEIHNDQQSTYTIDIDG